MSGKTKLDLILEEAKDVFYPKGEFVVMGVVRTSNKYARGHIISTFKSRDELKVFAQRLLDTML